MTIIYKGYARSLELTKRFTARAYDSHATPALKVFLYNENYIFNYNYLFIK